jgi:hypothetical protein
MENLNIPDFSGFEAALQNAEQLPVVNKTANTKINWLPFLVGAIFVGGILYLSYANKKQSEDEPKVQTNQASI